MNAKQADHETEHADHQATVQTLNTAIDALQTRLDAARVNPVVITSLNLPSRATPATPNPLRVALASVGLALVLAFGVPLLLTWTDNTLRVVEETEEALGIPNIGLIPRLQPRVLQEQDDDDESRALLETFRLLRTNLLVKPDVRKPPQMIVVTSSVPKEGKSTVACNLAQSFAKLGEDTLLADLDLRRGRLHEHFGQDLSPGIAELLGREDHTFADFFRQTDIDDLTLLPGGERLENVPEVLAGSRFVSLMRKCREHYDRIIIDAPPTLGLAETSALAAMADGTVFVVWCGYTPAPQAQTAVDQLQRSGADLCGFVFNRVDMRSPANYCRYYYHSEYYYSSYQD